MTRLNRILSDNKKFIHQWESDHPHPWAMDCGTLPKFKNIRYVSDDELRTQRNRKIMLVVVGIICSAALVIAI